MKHANEGATEYDSHSLRHWATKKEIVKNFLNHEVLISFEEVDNYLITWEFLSEPEKVLSENTFEPPSVQQVFSALKTISSFLVFNKFENDLKQTFDYVQGKIEKCLLQRHRK